MFQVSPFIPTVCAVCAIEKNRSNGKCSPCPPSPQSSRISNGTFVTTGILLQAAIGGALILFKGYGSTLLQDGGRRISLLMFAIFAALWAQVDFGTLLIPKASTDICQGVLIISTASDQLARISLEQFLLWTVAKGAKMSVVTYAMQGILVIRMIAAGVMVGFSRPSFEPTCVARSSLLPASITALTLDLIIIGFLIIRAVSLGMFGDLRDKQGSKKEQSKAFILTITGLVLWTATSVVMILGIPGFLLALKTALPANGLLILVGLVTVFSGTLLSTHVQLTVTPEAQSPYIGPETTSREVPRGIIASGSPRSGNRFTMGGRLRVVNETSQDSPTNHANQNRDNRGFTRLPDGVPQSGSSNQGQSSSSGYAPGYRGSSGLFGTNVAPIIGRDQAARNLSAVLPTTNKINEAAGVTKSLFPWSSKHPAKAPVRARGISNPIMAEDGDDNMPFSRVPTTDLVTAAKNERERREAAAFARSHPLISNPVTPQEFASPIAGPSQSAGFGGKELSYSPNERLSTVLGSTTTSLSALGRGSSTSMSVSPGRDEVRRRSPRNDNPFDTKISEKPMVPPKVQRTNTIGLPSGPRSQKLAAVVTSKEIAANEDSTILRVNTIVYNNPDAVNSIIRDAQDSYNSQQRPKTADLNLSSLGATIKSADSMIHRPPPYSRKYSETDRALFPAEPSHRQTKSTSSILVNRSSIFSSFPSTPAPASTLLPPLPRSAAELKKLFPSNSTGKSVDKQIELLFPAPPRAMLQNRRSSVPSVPRVPSIFMVDLSESRSPIVDFQPSKRLSKRTTISSFVQLPKIDVSSLGAQYDMIAVSRFSQSTTSHVTNLSLEAKTFEGFHANNLSLENRTFEGFRSNADATPATVNHSSTASSPINYKHSFPTITKSVHTQKTSTAKRSSTVGSVASSSSRDEDNSTEWASIHSRDAAVDLKKARMNARSTFIRGIVHDNDQNFAFQALPSPTGTESSEITDIIPVMLDTGRTEYSSYANSVSSRMSSARNSVDFVIQSSTTPIRPLFHHRIGDSLPTFSVRETQTRARKNSAPAPLQLNRIGRPTNYVVEIPELSPVESHERVIEEIMVQLENFDELKRESINFGSLDRDIRQLQIQERLQLLESLEREIDDQEDQWHNRKLNRNSVSTTMTNTPANPQFTRNPSTRTSRIISYVSSRSERFSSVQPRGGDAPLTNSTQSSDNSRASMWQTRLANAQLAYLESAPTLLRRSLNFLALPVQAASPTPPVSEKSIEIELELGSDSDDSDIEYSFVSVQTPMKVPAKLWEYGPPSPQAAMGRLWCHPYEEEIVPTTPEPPAQNMRIMQRFNVLPLQLSSTTLWTKPSISSNPRVLAGLWRSNLARPKSIITKRASIRPPRSNRRMTILADIVESPIPVPNKEESLGIFKFAWGETSDQPTYQPAFVPAPFSNFTANSSLNARSMQLEPAGDEYSSSFFEDYEDEHSDDGSESESEYSEDEYDNSEEEFNDNTLLEIADLLHSDAVPSRQSLFSSETIIEDYADEAIFVESSEADMRFLQAPVRLPIQPLSYSPRVSPRIDNFSHSPKPSPRYESFNVEDRYVEPDIFSASDDDSLDYFEDEIIVQMDPTFENFAAESYSSEEEFYSDSDDGSLIDFGMVLEPEVEIQPTINKGLWVLPEYRLDATTAGLFSFTNKTPSIRGTDLAPQNVGFARTPRSFSTELPKISSSNMWSKSEAPKEDKVWIWTSRVADAPISAPTYILWVSPSKVEEPVNKGLFKMSTQPTTYRTTSSEPAAIGMVSKTRSQQSLLPTLESTALWNGTQDLPVEHHWISESSFSPPSPSLYSPSPLTGMTTLTDRSSYDLFDTASIKTTSTKASSLWASMSSAATPTWRDREAQSAKKPLSPFLSTPDFRKSALSPSDAVAAREAEMNFRIPKLRRQKSKEICLKKGEVRGAQREKRIMEEDESEDEGAKRAQGMEFASIRASLRPAARRPLKPIAKPKYQRIQFTKADWDAALLQAMPAIIPKPVRKVVSKEDWIAELNKKATIVGPVNTTQERPAVTGEAEWVAALNEAVSAGTLHTPSRPTVLKDDWISELNTKSIIIGPAHVKKVRLVSNEADWEAALAEAVEKSGIVTKSVVTLWSSPSELPLPSITQLWSKTPIVERDASIFEISIPNFRKVLPAENTSFSILQSKDLWKPTQVVTTEINWITSKTPSEMNFVTAPGTWTLRKPSASLPSTTATLWTSPPPSTPITPTLFHTSAPSIRKALPAENPTFSVLQSKDLWKPTQVLRTEVNWIASQSEIAFVPTPVAPGTWTLRKASASLLPTTGLWTALTPSTPTTPTLFHVSTPSIRKVLPAENTTFSILSSTTLWAPTPPLSRPTHWLSTTSSSPSPKTWTPRHRSSTSPPTATTSLWSTPLPLSPTTPKFFTPSPSSTPKKAASYKPLQPLTSKHLFTPIPEVEKPLRTHWLLRSVSTSLPRPIVAVAVRPRAATSPSLKKVEKSMTWTSPSRSLIPGIEKTALWIPTTSSSSSKLNKGETESNQFTTATAQPWVRKTRSASENTIVFSSREEKLWEATSTEEVGSRNWLV